MATFYNYNKDGSVTGYLAEYVPAYVNPYSTYYRNAVYAPPQHMQAYNSPHYYGFPMNICQNWPGPVVANGSHIYPPTMLPLASSTQEVQERDSDSERTGSDELYDENDDDDGYQSEELLDAGYGSNESTYDSCRSSLHAQPSLEPGAARFYPDVDNVRKLHDMHSLLDHIQPDRLHSALYGPAVDVVEDGTNKILAYQVPKKMLILMCGRPAIAKYLRTLERADAAEGYGDPLQQELRIPHGTASHVGFKIVLAWMKRACYPKYTSTMEPIRVPKNLFAAISLARTLDLLGLHRDACRVDKIIANNHFKRPIYRDELASMWKCLPKDNKYLYGIVNKLRHRLDKIEQGRAKPLPEGVLEFLEENPELDARVGDPEVNDQYQPFFGREWCQYVSPTEESKQTRRGMSATCHVNMVAKKKTSAEAGKQVSVGLLFIEKSLQPEKKKFGVLRIVPPTPTALKMVKETEDEVEVGTEAGIGVMTQVVW